MYNLKGPQIAKTILKSKNKIKSFTLPYFQTQSCGNESRVALAQSDAWPNEINRAPRNKPLCVWQNDSQQGAKTI